MKTIESPREEPRCPDPSALLLEFYLNGSLEPGEGDAVRAHLESCDACALDFETLAGLAGTMTGTDQAPTAAARILTGGRLALAAVLVVAVSLGIAYLERHVARPAGSSAGTAGSEALLDLGAGAPRGERSMPRIALLPGTTSIRVRLFPPVEPEARYFASLVQGGAVVGAETPLGPLDAMGGGSVVFPSSEIATGGSHELVLRIVESDAGADGAGRIYRYPFEIEPGKASR
jgi:anti-sigma factor RsiW